MKFLVLGCGLQGKAAIYDLCRRSQVEQIICADVNPNALKGFEEHIDMSKIEFKTLDVSNTAGLERLMGSVDVTIDLLPSNFIDHVADIGIKTGTHVVNAMYGHQMSETLDERAKAKGITILPEAGLDPGIDLVLCGHGVRQFDKVYELHSWTGGFPDQDSINNLLKYKITWTWYGVLLSYYRASRFMKNGRIIEKTRDKQFDPEDIIVFEFPGVGMLEAFPNGDAITFCEHLGIMDTVRSASRRTLRWEGHCEIWRNFVELGFLNDTPVPGLEGITPIRFMEKHLEPQLQYTKDERDIVAMRTIIKGEKNGVNKTLIFDLVDKRDLETGLFAMNRTVGFTISIAAQMIAGNQITKRGQLTAVRDIPYLPMLDELKSRGIEIKEYCIDE
jgi:lysine 6-dehydrogenase